MINTRNWFLFHHKKNTRNFCAKVFQMSFFFLKKLQNSPENSYSGNNIMETISFMNGKNPKWWKKSQKECNCSYFCISADIWLKQIILMRCWISTKSRSSTFFHTHSCTKKYMNSHHYNRTSITFHGTNILLVTLFLWKKKLIHTHTHANGLFHFRPFQLRHIKTQK